MGHSISQIFKEALAARHSAVFCPSLGEPPLEEPTDDSQLIVDHSSHVLRAHDHLRIFVSSFLPRQNLGIKSQKQASLADIGERPIPGPC